MPPVRTMASILPSSTGGQRADLLGHVVGHGFENQDGLAVAGLDHFFHFSHVVDVEVGDDAALAGDLFLQRRPVVFARKVASSTRLQLGREPARSGAKGPSPFRALLTSTTWPSRWAPMEMPPPRWATISRQFS